MIRPLIAGLLCAWVLWQLDQEPHPVKSNWFQYHYAAVGGTGTERACDEWKARRDATETASRRLYLCLPDTIDPRGVKR